MGDGSSTCRGVSSARGAALTSTTSAPAARNRPASARPRSSSVSADIGSSLRPRTPFCRSTRTKAVDRGSRSIMATLQRGNDLGSCEFPLYERYPKIIIGHCAIWAKTS